MDSLQFSKVLIFPSLVLLGVIIFYNLGEIAPVEYFILIDAIFDTMADI